MQGLEIVGIADTVLARARNLARKFGIGNFYSDYTELLKNELDFVVLCTPSDLHGRMITDCCNRGINVLTEKPLAHDTKTALAAVRRAAGQGVKVCVVQNYRYYPAMQRAKKAIDAGRLGKVLAIMIVAHTPSPMAWTHSQWLFGGGGALDDFGPHAYDVMTWLAESSPSFVFALGHDASQAMGLINYAHVSVGFRNLVHGAVDLSWMSGSRIFSVDVYGTGGRLHVDVTSDWFEEIHGFVSPLTDLKNSSVRSFHTIREAALGRLLVGGVAYYDRVYQDFINYLRGVGPSPVSLIDSIRAVQIMDYSRKSASEKKALVVPDLGSTFTP